MRVPGLRLSPRPATDRASRAALARPQRRRARRGHRQAARPALPAGRAGDGQGQAAAHRGLRRRRLSLRLESARESARCCSASTTTQGLLDHVGFTSAIPAADRPELTKRLEALKGGAGLHRQGAGRPQPVEHRALGRMGAAEARAGGRGALRPGHRRAASATAPRCSAGGPTRTRGNARSSSWRRR